MLLHSIAGVGTNEFPLPLEKLPDLASLVTPSEMRQIESFPSVLRLLVRGPRRARRLLVVQAKYYQGSEAAPRNRQR